MWTRLQHQESVRPTGNNAVAAVLRFILKLANVLLALCGIAIMIYATYMFGEIHRRPAPVPQPPALPPPAPPSPAMPPAPPMPAYLFGAELLQHAPMPWFIFAFGGMGLFAFVTAMTGLIGAARNSRVCLGLYAFLAIVLLLAQAAVALAFFADAEWQKRLPHDETGEAKRLHRWIEKRMAVCKWVGLGVLLLQVVSVVVAFALSAVQQRALENDSEDDEEVWGRRHPLLPPSTAAATSGDVETGTVPTPEKDDPWSQRMRDKYGLDTSQFSYAPPSPGEGGPSSAGGAPAPRVAAAQEHQDNASSRCTIM